MNFKMFTYKSNYVLFLLIFQGYNCQRRIQEGMEVTSDKKYVVYLLKASISPKYYDGWLCGGALVSQSLILTSAACVTDVSHLYAIAGYNKYVSDAEIHNDPCTKEKKKKVVFICTPNGYEMSYENPDKWAFVDIAVVKVESPYDFTDTSYASVCSYTPTQISVNYDRKYQEPEIDAIVLGWGHVEKYREEMDLQDYNQKMLHYAPTMIIEKSDCKNEFLDYQGMNEVIDAYMICTDFQGNLDDAGGTINEPEPNAKGCDNRDREYREELRGDGSKIYLPTPQCEIEDNEKEEDVHTITRKLNNLANKTINDSSQKRNNRNNKRNNSVVDANNTFNFSRINKMNRTLLKGRRSLTRRYGICQNDHGGPLVTWVGAHEVLIGVATAFKISERLECMGPYLFTSTQCNGAFLACVLRDAEKNTRRGDICANLTQESGINITQTHISWENHPDGPAENEKDMTTHTLPANAHTNATSSQTFEEGKNMQQKYNNSTKLVYSNTSNTLENTTTTKVENVGGITAILTDTSSNNVKKTASVVLTSATFTNLSKTFANLTETNHSNFESAKPLSKFSKSNIAHIITTILMKNTSMNLRNTTTTEVYLGTSTENLIENASLARNTNLVETTHKSLTNSTVQDNTRVMNLTTSDTTNTMN